MSVLGHSQEEEMTQLRREIEQLRAALGQIAYLAEGEHEEIHRIAVGAIRNHHEQKAGGEQ